jgi:hypothetical protein
MKCRLRVVRAIVLAGLGYREAGARPSRDLLHVYIQMHLRSLDVMDLPAASDRTLDLVQSTLQPRQLPLQPGEYPVARLHL